MSRSRHEVSEEFTCIRTCEDPPCWIVEGRMNAEGEFEPLSHDEMGSDMDCPECGERGEPTDELLRVADL